MATTTTTLSSAVSVDDTSIVVASATGFAAGSLVRVDSEFLKVANNYVSGTTIPVLRGQDGNATAAHRASANVTVGLASDFAAVPQQASASVTNPLQPVLPIYSYSANGAIAPTAGIHVINGTTALTTLTLANPTKDQDGTILILIANGKAAHVVTITSGLGNGGTSSDVATFSASYSGGCILMAMNGFWNLIGSGMFSAGTPTGAPLWA